MTSTKFQIPLQFKTQLRPIELQNQRSNPDILKSLEEHVPVTSEKNLWAFWDKGVQAMPDWCKRNVCDWVRICGQGQNPWTIRILDAVPGSPNYVLNFVDKDMLPECFVKGTMTGKYVGPHSADFLRGAVLFLYGGCYMDVGCILFRHLDRVGWTELEDESSPYRIAISLMYGNTVMNHWVMARKGDPFIKRWHDLFVHLWLNRTEVTGLISHPLLHLPLSNTSLSEGAENAFDYDWKASESEVFEYVAQLACWMRLTLLENSPSDDFNPSEYWEKHILGLQVVKECWAAESVLGSFKAGSTLVSALNTSLDEDPESEEYKLAYEVVWRMLTQASMQKITHGKDLTHSLSAGVLWELEGNEGKDAAEGTFAELLRYGSVHWEQTRTSLALRETVKPKVTYRKGVLEV